MAYGRDRFRDIKIICAVIVGLGVIALCGYLLWLFHNIDFLPFWLNMAVRGLLAVMSLSAVAITVIAVRGIWVGD